jgi:hypothetical protein
MALRELTDRDRAVLAFELRYPRHTGAKEELIRSQFRLPPSRYYQLVNRLIDDAAALVAEPQLVKRLLAARDRRTKTRASATFTPVH